LTGDRTGLSSVLARGSDYAAATGVVLLATVLCGAMSPVFDATNLAMVYLLGVTFVATRSTRGAAAYASVLSVAAFDFFFIPPSLTFAVADSQYLLTFGVMLLVALLISTLAARARAQQVEVETERLRNSLLSSVSHDLRTPLTSITGAASSLLQAPGQVDDASKRELLETIHEEAFRLNLLVANLLDMTRLESGALKVRKEWLPIEEVIGGALTRLEARLVGRPVDTDVPDDLPLAPFDALLIEQVLVNLIENAVKYTPPKSAITISASATPQRLTVCVSDRGPGVPAGEETRVFEKFQRVEGRGHGSGLGLTICHGIVTAHAGTIMVVNREGGGASFRFTLPIEGRPPSMAETG
jgi:two-component system sensor histidine kinase KdpD